METKTLTRGFLYPIHQSPKWVDPHFKNTLCCGLFDLVIASSLLKDEVPSGKAVRRRVNQLVKWATHASYKDGTYSRVGEFFDLKTFNDFIDKISTEQIEVNRGYEEIILDFKNIKAKTVTFETESDLSQALNNLDRDQLVIFPYEPAYFASEEARNKKVGDHYLHFGVILPNTKAKKHYRVIQTSMGREVKKPSFNPLKLNHFATVTQLYRQNMKPNGFGYNWWVQFPWEKYAGDHAMGFSEETVPVYEQYQVSGKMLVLTKKG